MDGWMDGRSTLAVTVTCQPGAGDNTTQDIAER